jgi:D-glycero-D-manno-heptose 1,7-bisphosphate phosphatase
MRRRPAVFLDRDGTLIEEVGYVNHVSRVRLLPGAGNAVRRLRAAGWAVVVVTNQAGVARGYLSPELVDAAHVELARQLADCGTRLDGIYACFHHPTEGVGPLRAECDCRKPRPGLVQRAAAELQVDLERSVVVGDKPSDIELAAAVGIRGVLVLTGLGRGEWEHRRASFPVAPDYVAGDLPAAADWLLAEGSRTRTPRATGAGAC